MDRVPGLHKAPAGSLLNSPSSAGLGPAIEAYEISARVTLSRDNWSGVKSGPPVPIFACEIWTALAKVVRAYKGLQR